ncbi:MULTISPECIES: helix-turn-helix domain-containing protein [Kitasatospora]|uniref:Putative MarR family transcriptional regulator n=1 Tax=Kitasatospora setae (strain ATCC 33774 / DSM 43861 / JCM 3304 / KCC A-0304 / NBRC 14216 / KM-6054) TaxID=452652 RepID=E4N3C2_KITSK|nr:MULTISPECIES: helix-turn-helix domain-containing protein [Kitasatospora]BAJ32656.1 putative MarR family transcriptional regulator [Kitasatospora setae KM-6054]
MDGVRLLRLGKRLTELGRAMVTDHASETLTPGEIAVISDVYQHPGSSVQDIRARTGFAQSHVSTSVARLRERGLLDATADPADGRRTLLSVSALARGYVRARATRPAEPLLAKALADPAQAQRAAELLDELAALLLPTPAPTSPRLPLPPHPGGAAT